MESPQPRRLRPIGPDRVGHEEVGQPGGGEDLGLAEGADREAARSSLELQPRDPHALVGLGVRPEVDAPPIHLVLEAADVGGHALQVHDDRRRVEVVGQLPEGQVLSDRRRVGRHARWPSDHG